MYGSALVPHPASSPTIPRGAPIRAAASPSRDAHAETKDTGTGHQGTGLSRAQPIWPYLHRNWGHLGVYISPAGNPIHPQALFTSYHVWRRRLWSDLQVGPHGQSRLKFIRGEGTKPNCTRLLTLGRGALPAARGTAPLPSRCGGAGWESEMQTPPCDSLGIQSRQNGTSSAKNGNMNPRRVFPPGQKDRLRLLISRPAHLRLDGPVATK